MMLESDPEAASRLFRQAWEEANNPFEQFIAAHYMARQQPTVTDKLHWDQVALEAAQKANDETLRPAFPSLYLNIAKCYEDLQDIGMAREHYLLAASFIPFLSGDGYSLMIRSGIQNGVQRLQAYHPDIQDISGNKNRD